MTIDRKIASKGSSDTVTPASPFTHYSWIRDSIVADKICESFLRFMFILILMKSINVSNEFRFENRMSHDPQTLVRRFKMLEILKTYWSVFVSIVLDSLYIAHLSTPPFPSYLLTGPASYSAVVLFQNTHIVSSIIILSSLVYSILIRDNDGFIRRE